MTPDRHRKLFAAAVYRHGIDSHTLACVWAMRVLDAWRAKDRDARSWCMAEADDIRVDTCIVRDVVRAELRYRERQFPGTSPDAARIAAAKALSVEDPDILLAV